MPADQHPDQATARVMMPLLDRVTAQSLDEDYEHVAERRGPERSSGHDGGQQRGPGLAALVALLLFGVLVATAGVQTARNAGAASGGRSSLVAQAEDRTARLQDLRERAGNLEEEIAELRSLSLDTTARGRRLAARLEQLGMLTGADPVTGPGVEVVVDDAPSAAADSQRVLDEDLQKLVNALWASGAEAVSINGQRLTNLSAIRFAGDAITVNFVSLSGPYTVRAVGDPDTMPARFVETKHGQEWLDLRAVYGLEFEMTSEDSMPLPAAPSRRVSLRHARVGERS
jgi:uncharacterized protein YlxW (UPF0749 family)